MKKLIFFCILISVLLFNVSAADDISKLVSHYNSQTENYVPKSSESKGVFFADLIGYEWAEESIYALTRKNIISGYGNGVFAPQNNIKIKEFIKLLVLSTGLYNQKSECDYQDVSKNDWSYKYIASAKNANLLGLFDEKILNPDVYITREQAAFMCAKALEFYELDLSDKTEVLFTDDNEILAENKAYVYKLKNANIISGMGDGTFAPKDNLKRCEVAVIIFKLRNTLVNNL